MSNETQGPTRKGAAGLVFVGFIITGLAVGIYTGQTAVAVLAGLGLGFIAMAIVRSITGEW